MATEVARLRAVLDADTDPFKRGIRSADSSMSKFTHAVKMGALAAGAAIGTGLAISAKVGFDEFREGQRVAAQTAAVLKSTGGAANVTAKQIDDLATSLMNKTGIDDEAIKSGANLLLTFRDIRNETGKGNDIFDQATKTVQDMSVALGQDTKASAIQLGKALNDPIRGITALRRVGVSFNDQQTETITKLVEQGKTMEAQKLILRELGKEFGGSAVAAGKTFDGQLNILKETFKNTAGEIIGRFIPIVTSLAKVLLPLITKALDFVADAIEGIASSAQKRGGQIRGVFERIWGFIKENVVPVLLTLRDIAVETFHRFRKVIEDNRPALERIGERLGKLAQFLARILLPIIKVVFQEVLPRVLNVAIQIIDKVSGAIEKVVDWVRRAYNWIHDKLGNPTVRNAIHDTLIGPFETVANKVRDIIGFIQDMIDLVRSIPDKVSGAFSWVPGVGDGVIGAGIGAAAGAGLASVSPTLYDDIALGQAQGLAVSSGYRPGAVTSTGNPSLHGVYPAKAVDMSGSPDAMRRFFLMEVARGTLTGLREVIHSPYWWHPGSGIQRIPASAGTVLQDHFNHVHVGSYDKGGFLRPGWNLAYNGLGRPERVGNGDTNIIINAEVMDDHAARWIMRKLEEWQRKGGR